MNTTIISRFAYYLIKNKAVKQAILVVLASIALNACSNAVEGTNLPKSPSPNVDKTVPTYTVTPNNSGLLPATGAITIAFSESMDTTSLQVSNDLASEVAQQAWSTTSFANDTLSLSPNTRWSDGLQRSIRIEANDKAGNASTPIILSYDIDSTPPQVTANPAYTISNTPLTVTLSCDDGQGTGCKAIYYTIDGTIPTTDSLLYSGPVRIDRTTKFKYIGVDNAGAVSNFVSGWYTIDLVPPIGVVTPNSNQIIGSQQDIEVEFSESMDINSLGLSGSLAAEVGVIEWTTVTTSNDHLILHPVSGSNWSLGVDATLTIAAQDLAGNALEDDFGNTDVNLTYDIGTIHVSIDDTNASDANPGTKTLPVQTIQSAITLASSLPGPSQVLVAQGTYTASNLSITGINLVEQVSLFGGYSPDWSTRDPFTYTSTIGAGKLPTIPSYVPLNGLSWIMQATTGITWRTAVDGFAIDGGNGLSPTGLTSAIYITNGASPTIRYNIITGGNVDGEVFGVYIDNASPMLESNTISGSLTTKSSSLATNSHAIYSINNANPLIKKSTINGGNAITKAFGLYFDSASATIKNNDISAGNAATVYGIYSVNSSTDMYNNVLANLSAQQDSYGIAITSGSQSNIYNNIVDPGSLAISATGVSMQGGSSLVVKNNIITSGTCIQEVDIDSDPLAVENNDLFNCKVPYYDADSGCTGFLDGDGLATTCNVEEINLLTDMTAANNLTDEPFLQDPANGDYHFTVFSPTSVVEGGLDLSTYFTTDKDNIARIIPWSIGAYTRIIKAL